MKKQKLRRKFTFVIVLLVVTAIAGIVGSTRLVRVSVNSETLEETVTPKNYADSSILPSKIELNQIKTSNSKTAILFTSSWCGSCSKLVQDLKLYSSEYPEIQVYVLDLETYRDLATSLNVGLTPTLVLVQDQRNKAYQEVRIESLEEILKDFNRIGVR